MFYWGIHCLFFIIKFGQVNSLLSRQAEGTGIGLSLVKLLVETLGGEITLKSREGVGSTFTVFLPGCKVKDSKKKQPIKPICDNRLIEAVTIEFSDIII